MIGYVRVFHDPETATNFSNPTGFFKEFTVTLRSFGMLAKLLSPLFWYFPGKTLPFTDDVTLMMQGPMLMKLIPHKS